MTLYLADDYSISDFDNTLWSGAKDRWEDYTDEQKEFLMNYFASYAYDNEEAPSLTSFNDFIWFEADDILKDNNMADEDVITETYSITKDNDGWWYVELSPAFVTEIEDYIANAGTDETVIRSAFEDTVTSELDGEIITLDNFDDSFLYNGNNWALDDIKDEVEAVVAELYDFIEKSAEELAAE